MHTTEATVDGVSVGVREAMVRASANVLTEDGLMLRTCEHGIRHPVGHISPPPMFDVTHEAVVKRHEKHGRYLPARATCCGCVCGQAQP